MLICALYLYIDRYWLYLQLLLNYSTQIIQKLVNKQKLSWKQTLAYFSLQVVTAFQLISTSNFYTKNKNLQVLFSFICKHLPA